MAEVLVNPAREPDRIGLEGLPTEEIKLGIKTIVKRRNQEIAIRSEEKNAPSV